MNQIIKSKRPTILQLLKMAENLSEKHRRYCSIDVNCRKHQSSPSVVTYYIYIEDICQDMGLSVNKLYRHYFKLMGG